MNKTNKLLLCVLYFFLVTTVICQQKSTEKSEQCMPNTSGKGKYKILSTGLGGVESQIYLEIKLKYRTDKNYFAIAKQFRAKYCHEEKLRLIYYASKEQRQILDPKDIQATPLAIYYLNKNTGEEGVHIYQIVNGKIETRVLDFK